MSILIRKPGILTTVQDLGRPGYRRFGINPGGVMDRTAARLVNYLLGNDGTKAVLEMHFPAAEIVFENPCTFAIGGADLSPKLDQMEIENWRSYTAKKGGVLRFGAKKLGNRAYLAIRGGLAVDEWLGSASTNLTAHTGGYMGRPLRSGDRMEFNDRGSSDAGLRMRRISTSIIPRYSCFPTVRVIAGAEFALLKDGSKSLLESHNFNISNNSNRMGFRLAGKPLSLTAPLEMISSAASFGTIQLLPDGQIIVLMADHQTAGGYPRIAHVIECDLPVMAQLGGGDQVAFHLVTLEEAEALNAKRERDISLFRVGCGVQAQE